MKDENKKIKVVGLGGIGSYLVEPLSRYLSNEYKEIEITLIDGDSYETKNECRQRFSSLDNKAAVTATDLSPKFPNILFKAKRNYIDVDNVTTFIRENDIVFLCVDNHNTRKIVSDRCDELDNVTLISGGNEYTDGNVVIFRRVDGENVGKPLTELFPEIANPQDKHPSEVEERNGCEAQVELNPQLLFMNNTISAIMCNVYYTLEQNRVNFEQVYTDILTQRSRPTPENNIFE